MKFGLSVIPRITVRDSEDYDYSHDYAHIIHTLIDNVC